MTVAKSEKATYEKYESEIANELDEPVSSSKNQSSGSSNPGASDSEVSKISKYEREYNDIFEQLTKNSRQMSEYEKEKLYDRLELLRLKF